MSAALETIDIVDTLEELEALPFDWGRVICGREGRVGILAPHNAYGGKAIWWCALEGMAPHDLTTVKLPARAWEALP